MNGRGGQSIVCRMRISSIGLAAATAAIVAMPTAAHAGPEDTWRHVYFTPMATIGQAEAAGPHDVWQLIHKQFSLVPSVAHWTGGSTWRTYSLPGFGSFFGSEISDLEVVAPDDVWVSGREMVNLMPDLYTTYLARWNGAKWTEVASPTGSRGRAGILASDSTSVWLYEAGGVYRWEDDAWRQTGTVEGYVRALHAFSPDSAVVASDRGLWRWDGTAWTKAADTWPSQAKINGPDSAWYADKNGLHLWDGSSWQAVPYTGAPSVDEAEAISESDGLWVRMKETGGTDSVWRYKDGTWTRYANMPYPVTQVVVDDAGRVWAVDRVTRFTPTGNNSYTAEHKGRIRRLADNGLGWQTVSSVPEADYRLVDLPGSDRIYAYGRNGWTGTHHITTNAPQP